MPPQNRPLRALAAGAIALLSLSALACSEASDKSSSTVVTAPGYVALSPQCDDALEPLMKFVNAHQEGYRALDAAAKETYWKLQQSLSGQCTQQEWDEFAASRLLLWLR